MEGLRFPELLIILLLIALLFGPQKIAGIGAGLGKAIRGFKDAVGGSDEAPPQAGPHEEPRSAITDGSGSEPGPTGPNDKAGQDATQTDRR